MKKLTDFFLHKAGNPTAIILLFVLLLTEYDGLLAQKISFGAIVQGGATNVNGIDASALGGRAGLRFSIGDGTVSGIADLCYTGWRDNVLRTGDSLDIRFNNRFNRLEFAPGAEVALSGRLRLGAGAYVAYLLGAKERFRDYNKVGDVVFDFTRTTTGLFNAVDFGLRFQLAFELRPGLRLEALFSQGLTNISVLYAFGVKAVSQGMLVGLVWTPGAGK
jgi:hypothetical protein